MSEGIKSKWHHPIIKLLPISFIICFILLWWVIYTTPTGIAQTLAFILLAVSMGSFCVCFIGTLYILLGKKIFIVLFIIAVPVVLAATLFVWVYPSIIVNVNRNLTVVNNYDYPVKIWFYDELAGLKIINVSKANDSKEISLQGMMGAPFLPTFRIGVHVYMDDENLTTDRILDESSFEYRLEPIASQGNRGYIEKIFVNTNLVITVQLNGTLKFDLNSTHPFTIKTNETKYQSIDVRINNSLNKSGFSNVLMDGVKISNFSLNNKSINISYFYYPMEWYSTHHWTFEIFEEDSSNHTFIKTMSKEVACDYWYWHNKTMAIYYNQTGVMPYVKDTPILSPR